MINQRRLKKILAMKLENKEDQKLIIENTDLVLFIIFISPSIVTYLNYNLCK
jgi:hypothetical protein